MAQPSLKNVSTAEIEAAIAQALAALTGWETCTVRINTVDFEKKFDTSEDVSLKLGIAFSKRITKLRSITDDAPLGS